MPMTRATRLSASAGSAEMQNRNPSKISNADRTTGPQSFNGSSIPSRVSAGKRWGRGLAENAAILVVCERITVAHRAARARHRNREDLPHDAVQPPPLHDAAVFLAVGDLHQTAGITGIERNHRAHRAGSTAA